MTPTWHASWFTVQPHLLKVCVSYPQFLALQQQLYFVLKRTHNCTVPSNVHARQSCLTRRDEHAGRGRKRRAVGFTASLSKPVNMGWDLHRWIYYLTAFGSQHSGKCRQLECTFARTGLRIQPGELGDVWPKLVWAGNQDCFEECGRKTQASMEPPVGALARDNSRYGTCVVPRYGLHVGRGRMLQPASYKPVWLPAYACLQGFATLFHHLMRNAAGRRTALPSVPNSGACRVCCIYELLQPQYLERSLCRDH